MQFNSNSDFPASRLSTSQWVQVARPPDQFDPADFVPCACITTHVLSRFDLAHGLDATSSGDACQVVVGGMNYVVKTAKGVLVSTAMAAANATTEDYDDALSSFVEEQASGDDNVIASSSRAGAGIAYWLRRTLRAAIYGNVRYGVVLHKLQTPVHVILPNSSKRVAVEWEETSECVAVKEMSWEHIRYHDGNLAEDPIREVAAMQYLTKWFMRERQQQNSTQMMPQMGFVSPASGDVACFDVNPQLGYNTGVMAIDLPNIVQWMGQQQAMPPPQASAIQNTAAYQTPQDGFESHIMMSMDLLSDDRYLYSIMPCCNEGELFDLLERKKRLTEPEARYWMRQLLRCLSCLKKAGVCHRDLSLDNILVHDGKILLIDMGMCLRVPVDNISGRRFLIHPQGMCGKWHYMSPEVCKNQLPFDGPAVDLWAAGVILFLMLTGFPPWERPDLTDKRFMYMSNGYLVQMLTEWQVGLSADAMDLLQRMFWLDPTDRLSLEQVYAHPWMSRGLPEYCV
ncbi:hypothetical protein ACHAW5_011194 [Stephanodiscus triporus]|uniref:Protein kinase domain-containing protein n=1 Tax=Stephanodiscus triporus TaxID=2934178 RepID=A0ABD3QXA1_9STRA